MSSFLQGRVTVASWTAGLAIGDGLVLAAFVLVGGIFGHDWGLMTYLGRLAGSATPFLLGWYLAALIGGLYTPEATASVRNALLWSVPAWLVAVFVAQALRSTEFFPGNAPLSFILVSLLFGGLFVLGWRVLATVALGFLRAEATDVNG